jgi:hypothetical protein
VTCNPYPSGRQVLVSDFLWLLGMFVGLMLVVGAGWWAWYVLVSYRQRMSHARAVQLAESRGLPPPDRPAPPDLLNVAWRWSRIGGLLGLGGALVAILVLTISTCSHH